MRRKEKQMSEESAVSEVVRRAQVCRLAMSDGLQPYVVPLCFGFADRTLYLHAATEGRKLDIIKKNNRVCFEFDVDTELVRNTEPCSWTMRYKSVIGFGEAVLVEGAEEKRAALQVIMNQYSNDTFAFPDQSLGRIAVIKVAVHSMSGKQSGY